MDVKETSGIHKKLNNTELLLIDRPSFENLPAPTMATLQEVDHLFTTFSKYASGREQLIHAVSNNVRNRWDSLWTTQSSLNRAMSISSK